MNKIPKCKNKNAISKQNLKLTKKYSGENYIINAHQIKNLKQNDSNKYLEKEVINSIIKTLKPSTITTASSKNNSLLSNKNVISYFIFNFILTLIFIYILVKKCSKKLVSSSTQIIQKTHSIHSESRNIRNLKQKRAYNSSKMMSGVTIQTKRKLSRRSLNTRNKIFKCPINSIQSFGGLRNSVSFISINTNIGSPWIGVNESNLRMDNGLKKKIHFSNHVKNALL